MNLTVTHAGQHSAAGLHYSWSVDDDTGTRWADQTGDVVGYADDATALTAELEALLAALEWIHPVQFAPVQSLALQPTPAAAVQLAGPPLADPHHPAARCAAYLDLFRRRGVVVTVGGRSIPPVPKPRAKKRAAALATH